MKTIKLNAVITGIRSNVDRSLGLSVSTPELSVNERALFMELQGLNVDLTIVPLEESNPEVEKIDRDVETKKPSQRLRAVLYVLWEQRGKQGEFNDFYRTQMEKVIEAVKSKLDQ
jgi:hypothetical protein